MSNQSVFPIVVSSKEQYLSKDPWDRPIGYVCSICGALVPTVSALRLHGFWHESIEERISG